MPGANICRTFFHHQELLQKGGVVSAQKLARKKIRVKLWPNPFSHCGVNIFLGYNLGTFLGMGSTDYGKALKSKVKGLVFYFEAISNTSRFSSKWLLENALVF